MSRRRGEKSVSSQGAAIHCIDTSSDFHVWLCVCVCDESDGD